VFSGSFSVYYGYSFDDENFVESQSDKMALDLNATIDEFNTVSVKVGLADALYFDDSVDGALNAFDGDFANRGDYLRMDQYYLTSDITGALGVDGPVGVTMEFGKYGLASTDVSGKAPSSYTSGSETDNAVAIGMDFDIMGLATLSVDTFPGSWINAEAVDEFGITLKAMGIADMVDVAAYFILSEYDPSKDFNGDTVDGDGDSVGGSVGVAVTDMIGVGANFEYRLDDEVALAGLNVGFTMDALALGVAGKIGDFDDLEGSMAVKLSASYMLSDALSVYGALEASGFDNFEAATSLAYDAGIKTALAGLGVQVGFSNNYDFIAPEDDFANVLYMKLSVAF
jgi:hypothetical protein